MGTKCLLFGLSPPPPRMPLALTTSDQARIGEAFRALASPVAAPTARAWRRAAGEAVAAAVGRGAAVFVAPAWDGVSASDALDAHAVPEYERHLPYLVRTGAFARCVRLGVATRREAYGPRYDEVVRSPYVQEFLPAVRSFDSLTLTAPLRARPRTHADAVQLAVVSPDRGRAFSDQHAATARLLHPAFVAGVRVFALLRCARARLRATVDATGAACVVADRAGRVLHRTQALEAALGLEPERGRVADAAERLARAFFGPAPVATAVLRTRRGRYRLTASEVTDGAESFVVILVEADRPRAAPAEVVAHRYGLTPRQAEVAVLLAERATNKEIAAALAVSVHTARHHVEAVLDRLGVRRADVATAVQAGALPPDGATHGP